MKGQTTAQSLAKVPIPSTLNGYKSVRGRDGAALTILLFINLAKSEDFDDPIEDLIKDVKEFDFTKASDLLTVNADDHNFECGKKIGRSEQLCSNMKMWNSDVCPIHVVKTVEKPRAKDKVAAASRSYVGFLPIEKSRHYMYDLYGKDAIFLYTENPRTTNKEYFVLGICRDFEASMTTSDRVMIEPPVDLPAKYTTIKPANCRSMIITKLTNLLSSEADRCCDSKFYKKNFI